MTLSRSLRQLRRISIMAGATTAAMLYFLLVSSPCNLLAADGAGDEWEEVNTKEQDPNAASVKASDNRPESEEQAREAEEMRTASSKTVRRFHEVLDEMLAEFGYDVKLGQIKGLKNLAIRKVEVSNSLPHTYEQYVELLIAERIRENSQIRLINCIVCKTRTSTLVEGKLMVTSPTTNIARLDQAATQLGIDNFMDIILVYHTTHMVLAMNIFDAGTKELVWARTYNSETIKSRYQKLAIDYSQVAKSRPGEDYAPEYRYLVGIGGGILPNVAGTARDKSFLVGQFRGSEKFDNRKSEFGLLLSFNLSDSSILSKYPTEGTAAAASDTAAAASESGPTPKPYKYAITLLGTYGHLFVGSVESYNDVRHGLNLGLGCLLATGYLAPAARIGWDMFFGRRFSVGFGVLGVKASSILVGSSYVDVSGGGGGDVIMSLNF